MNATNRTRHDWNAVVSCTQECINQHLLSCHSQLFSRSFHFTVARCVIAFAPNGSHRWIESTNLHIECVWRRILEIGIAYAVCRTVTHRILKCTTNMSVVPMDFPYSTCQGSFPFQFICIVIGAIIMNWNEMKWQWRNPVLRRSTLGARVVFEMNMVAGERKEMPELRSSLFKSSNTNLHIFTVHTLVRRYDVDEDVNFIVVEYIKWLFGTWT